MERIEVPIRGIRLCVLDTAGTYRKMARLDWSNSDESLYITSYCPPGGMAYAGRSEWPLDAHSYTFDYTGQSEARDGRPKMSLHASGMTKTELAGQETRFIIGKPLFNPDGGYIATIKSFRPQTLPEIDDLTDRKGVSNVLAVTGEHQWSSVRFPIAVHTDEMKAFQYKFVLTFRRPKLAAPLYVGIDVIGEWEPDNDGDGVIVFGGWGPELRPSEITEAAFTVTKGSDDMGRQDDIPPAQSTPPGQS